MKIRFLKTAFILLTTCVLVSCSPTPIPPDKAEYVGLWVSPPDRYISIFGNGRLEYRKKLWLGMHNRVQSNFIFDGNRLDTSMFVTFDINKPPYEENSEWKMVMENNLYTRIGPPVVYGRSNNWPKGIE